jgi:hypothetical protein
MKNRRPSRSIFHIPAGLILATPAIFPVRERKYPKLLYGSIGDGDRHK